MEWFSEVAQFLKLHCFLPLFDEGFQPHSSHLCPCACASREQNLATKCHKCVRYVPQIYLNDDDDDDDDDGDDDDDHDDDGPLRLKCKLCGLESW